MRIDLLSLGITSLVLTLIQAGIFFSMPDKMRDTMAGVPIFGVCLNWCASTLILHFTGVGSFVGIANMLASLLFAGMLIGYRRAFRISDARIVWDGIKPGIEIIYK